ncbi:Hypothetical protein, putative [Bodo saltans]|uniref:Uncharacterized protein n=1 Tax=Bodo saltans TaxID=75058 RepID=A0A0S4JG76_BODSA|nr:Hypothetical protein, putative [Bodo saltans]|eukprot:CUG90489.1 Hypothetical protein, putative [Bodo saltans]
MCGDLSIEDVAFFSPSLRSLMRALNIPHTSVCCRRGGLAPAMSPKRDNRENCKKRV